MNDHIRIAILMTCFNRRDLTLNCLAALSRDRLFDAANLFLVDDGSSDGTGDAVRAIYPAATVIQGDGFLFWNGGMRLAWDSALAAQREFSHYFWLNDDVELRSGALSSMVSDAVEVAPADGAVIVVGAMTDPQTGAVNYSGHDIPLRYRPLHLETAIPEGKPRRVRTMSGNAVLVSSSATQKLGNLDPRFEHIFGDLDYGLRAGRAGVPVYLASHVAGSCGSNKGSGWQHQAIRSRWGRVRAAMAKQDTIHARDWRRFIRIHSGLGPFSVVYRLSPILRAFFNRPKVQAPRFPGSP